MLLTPRALLLDFGGVIVDGHPSPNWASDVADIIVGLIREAGVSVPLNSVITEGLVEAEGKVDAIRFMESPMQPTREYFWSEIVGAGWPAEVREVVSARALYLSRRLAELKFASRWSARPGIREFLEHATALDLPLAVVSNAISGAVHRDFLEHSKLAIYFDVQVYSDEQGSRKPNPALVWQATGAIGVRPADCWFVGDTYTRDVLAARRAGCGAAVLMRSMRADKPDCLGELEPDAIVADPNGLDELLRVKFVTM